MLEYPTLKQMRDQIARQIGDTSDDRVVKIDEWINTHYSEVSRKKAWPQLLRSSEEEISFTAGAAYVYLPKTVETLYFVMPHDCGEAVNLAMESILRNASISFRNTGLVFAYADAGESGRRMDFYSLFERLTLTTTGSTAVNAVVHGSVTSAAPNVSSQELREEVTIAPSTGITTDNAFSDIYSVGVAELTDSTVTVTGATSGNIYATIGEGEQTARYRKIRLMQPDQQGTAVTLVWKKRPFKLISDNQAIEIPVGTQLIDAVISTMLVQQREYNAASIYHQGRAARGVDESFDASQTQGDRIYLAQPMGGGRGEPIIIQNP